MFPGVNADSKIKMCSSMPTCKDLCDCRLALDNDFCATNCQYTCTYNAVMMLLKSELVASG